MQLDRLEVDVEQARVPEPFYNAPGLFKAPCNNIVFISACGRLARDLVMPGRWCVSAQDIMRLQASITI